MRSFAMATLSLTIVKSFDWHSEPISLSTHITSTYKNTQNVRRFFKPACGAHFKFDRPFIA